MKKILLNSNILWTITQFRKDLIMELNKNYEVVCVADNDDFSDNSVEIIETLGIEYVRIKLNRKGVNPFGDFFYFLELLKLYKKIKPDLVIHYTIKPNIYGSLAAKILKIHSFAVVSGLGSTFIKDNFLTKIITTLYKVALSKTQKVLFLNQDDREIFLKLNIIKEKQSLVLPGEGVDADYYRGCDAKNHNESKITFLMIARLLKDKGVYEYIEAIKNIKSKNVQFLLAGVFDKDNPTSIKEQELQKWIDDKTVTYLGKTDNVKEFFQQADVIVLPSYREGLSRVLLEACCCEKFIVASDIAGCKELCVDGHNGFLALPKDTASLTSALNKTINLTKEERVSKGKLGRELVINHYSSSIVNGVYKKLIEETF